MALINLFAEKEWRPRYREWICGHSRGRREWNEQKKSSIDIYIYTLLRVKQIAGKKLFYNTGSPA